MAMRILLLGKNGQLGWEFQRTLPCLGELFSFDWPEIDFLRLNDLRDLVHSLKPDVVVNAAAYTAVDRAESEPTLCAAINTLAPAALAEECETLNSFLIHYSTDYVFDGSKGAPYDESDLPNPLNTYGKTKLEGERLIQQTGCAYWIFRTSWVYSHRRDSFVTKIQEWSRRQKVLRIVNDQFGCPTWSRMLAEISTQALAMGLRDIRSWTQQTEGLYHLAGSGHTSRFEWAQEILKLDPHHEEQIVEQLQPATTADFPTPARRPLFAPLNCERFRETFGLQLPSWSVCLRLMMASQAS